MRKPEENYLEDLGIGGRVLLKCVFKKLDGGSTDWIAVAQYRDRWRAVVDEVINFWVP